MRDAAGGRFDPQALANTTLTGGDQVETHDEQTDALTDPFASHAHICDPLRGSWPHTIARITRRRNNLPLGLRRRLSRLLAPPLAVPTAMPRRLFVAAPARTPVVANAGCLLRWRAASDHSHGSTDKVLDC
ncbi:hypothetical protein LPU83_pLPU83d_0802 (plasmid) [Rhizobium favelukesii]|uniref:Uncharacterized protein n=1 Tax=Rhizobium favelukesii TaxID=348824 RepID=W6RM19_9HYPH|nr:hypothetical protein LPU83_pLPU83d_0802 [Rhizobium favelukesii]